MVKVVLETGGGTHTSSHASLQARVRGGGYLYQLRQYIKHVEWEDKLNEKWALTEFDLPDGMEIYIDGKGRSGPRGVEKYSVKRLYRVDAAADIVDEQFDLGIHQCLLKGRLVLVKDDEKDKKEINLDKGF